ncbi:GNAT family N-acetyltransferase [Waterburya agarophytonicola K14]|uniref:GNAT family N-acetyltransferase n=1 Tax=Waterburya agarophytonicola KI4 TaxID=2874699 RepID=A0A964FFA1_9CYAN|nr:GNAT family N-acetyltransferase [Waterburya agarophytonicola]MCC0176696.1 GNAT family N-acetyltransferase [Waterburya agarophytonicola KI4]
MLNLDRDRTTNTRGEVMVRQIIFYFLVLLYFLMESKINQKIVIRRAKPEDKYAIVNIQYNALKVLAAKDYNPRQLNALLRSKSIPRKSPETIFIAEIDRQPVGFASLLHPLNTIGAMFVDPKFARKQIGTQLLQRIEAEAMEQRIPILWVYSSLTGYSFYKANGYKNIRKTVLPLYSTYIPCMQMKKRLSPITKDEILREISQLLAVLILAIIIIFFFSTLLAFLSLAIP